MNQHVGIGYRKDFGSAFLTSNSIHPAFVELAPENWIEVGGYWRRQLEQVAERYPILSHGLSLSIGSPDPLDLAFIKQVKHFLEDWNVQIYSEHLSFSQAQNAHLYDLLPIPFRQDAVNHVVERIQRVQDILQRKLVIEIVSYYTPVAAEMNEVDFINAITKRADCELLLDVNNIFVNGFNHGYDPRSFIDSLDTTCVRYIHMAGHEQVSPDLIIDTHGQPIADPVYDLFNYALQRLDGPVPVLLERDFNIPALSDLQDEMDQLEVICNQHWQHAALEA